MNESLGIFLYYGKQVQTNYELIYFNSDITNYIIYNQSQLKERPSPQQSIKVQVFRVRVLLNLKQLHLQLP